MVGSRCCAASRRIALLLAGMGVGGNTIRPPTIICCAVAPYRPRSSTSITTVKPFAWARLRS
jgi:hypothetical protein